MTQNHEGLSGVSISAAIEGIRPFLIETQALVSTAAYGLLNGPATGFDIRRMNMLLPYWKNVQVLNWVQKDVFLNIAGGLKVNDPAIDLAVISAVLSSSLDISIEKAGLHGWVKWTFGRNKAC